MNKLDTNRICHYAPYKVWQDGEELRFETEHDILYAVNFEPENMLANIPAYWFGLFNRSNKPSPNDVKIRATVTCILEEFFRVNPDILLYLCDTASNQQAIRSRLFLRWFNAYAKQQNFFIRTDVVLDEGEENYITIIVQRTHPQLMTIISTFDSVMKQFKAEKP